VGLLGRSRGALAVTAGLALLGATALPASASAGVPGYPYVSATFDVNENTQAPQDVDCPGGGDMAISGGAYNGAPINEMLWLKSSRPGSFGDPSAKTAWTVQVQNVFDPITTNYPGAEAWVICDDGGLGDYKVRRKRDVKVKRGQQITAFPKCKGSEGVVGGGADVSGGIGEAVWISSSYPRDDRDRDERPDGWGITADAAGLDTATTLDAYAVCDRKRASKRYRYETSTVEVPDGEQGSAIADCGGPLDPRVGGGVRSRSKFSHQLRINSTEPVADTGWEGVVDNFEDPKNPDGKAREITATAICLKA
jgi:hypothetical protein